MTNELYDRKIELIFGVPGDLGNKYTDVRISFKVEKTSASTPNKGEIKVYNLTQASRALSEKKGLKMLLRAGYGENLVDIYKGDIFKSVTSLEGTDYVTTFELGDGLKTYQESVTDVSFKGGTSIFDVVNTVVGKLGLTVGDISAAKEGKFLGGLALSGLSRDHLDYITKKQGLEWSIQDDAVQIIKKGGVTVETAVLLNSSTGLLEVPKKKDKGIELKCLLNPLIKPGRAIRVESRFLTGSTQLTGPISANFRCTNVKFNGDNFDKDFNCEIEADPIK